MNQESIWKKGLWGTLISLAVVVMLILPGAFFIILLASLFYSFYGSDEGDDICMKSTETYSDQKPTETQKEDF